MCTGRKKGLALCLALAVLAGGISGCAGRQQLPAAYSYTFSEDSGDLDEKAGERIEWQGRRLCVIKDESAFEDEEIAAPVAVMLNITDKKVLFSRNAHQKMPPASLTTLATALVVLNHMELTDEVEVSAQALVGTEHTSVVGLEPGDRLTVEQLLHGMLMCSGVDAANALAIAAAGSVDKFTQLMNQEAKALGCTDCSFENPGGVTAAGHYMTAYDVYVLLNTLMEDSRFTEIFGKSHYKSVYKNSEGETVEKDYESTVGYLSDVSLGGEMKKHSIAVLGGKTGTTQAARHCLTVCLQDAQGDVYVGILMSAATRDALYQQMDRLISKIL